jgi:heme exporter protein D
VNTRLSHEQAVEQLPAAALEILDQAEQAGVTEHARSCAECGPQLEDYRRVAGDLATLIPGQALNPARASLIRRRLMDRVRTGQPRNPARIFMAERWSGWMVAAGLAGVLLVHHGFHHPLAYGWVAAGLLLVALVVLGVHTRVQRARVTALESRIASLEEGRQDP